MISNQTKLLNQLKPNRCINLPRGLVYWLYHYLCWHWIDYSQSSNKSYNGLLLNDILCENNNKNTGMKKRLNLYLESHKNVYKAEEQAEEGALLWVSDLLLMKGWRVGIHVSKHLFSLRLMVLDYIFPFLISVCIRCFLSSYLETI